MDTATRAALGGRDYIQKHWFGQSESRINVNQGKMRIEAVIKLMHNAANFWN